MLMFLLLFLACRGSGEVLDTGELRMEFENVWWETVDEPMLEQLPETLCFSFNTDRYRDDPVDGKLIYFLEGSTYSHPLSDFERTDNGYYLTEYDIDVEILVDDEGNYTAKVKSGILSQRVDIILCSLGQ